jgi:hypothetical protein
MSKKIFKVISEKPPEGSKGKKGELFCCYCDKWMDFKEDVIVGSNHDRCVGCTISVEDYYIKSANKLWQKDLQKPIKMTNSNKTTIKKKENTDNWSGDYV